MDTRTALRGVGFSSSDWEAQELRSQIPSEVSEHRRLLLTRGRGQMQKGGGGRENGDEGG